MTKSNSKLINLVGQKFNRLKVISRSDKRSKSGAIWECLCDCGNYTDVLGLKLRQGKTKSCGCYRKKLASTIRFKHGMSKNRTYRTWKEMRQRCNNINSDKWRWYGARGINICARWEDFTLFVEDMGVRPMGHTLDRIDSDGNYEPSNCRWATPSQQAETNRGCFIKGQTPWNKRIA